MPDLSTARHADFIDNGIADNTVIIVTSDNAGLSTKEYEATRERATHC
jgi:arylsulfatase A-like enzyme